MRTSKSTKFSEKISPAHFGAKSHKMLAVARRQYFWETCVDVKCALDGTYWIKNTFHLVYWRLNGAHVERGPSRIYTQKKKEKCLRLLLISISHVSISSAFICSQASTCFFFSSRLFSFRSISSQWPSFRFNSRQRGKKVKRNSPNRFLFLCIPPLARHNGEPPPNPPLPLPLSKGQVEASTPAFVHDGICSEHARLNTGIYFPALLLEYFKYVDQTNEQH